MSTQQATLTGDFLGQDDDSIDCPLCGGEVSSKVALPDHIASDDCDTEHKEVRYE